MAKIKLLVDTDIIIDSLRGIKSAKELFRSAQFDIYCSVLSKKELLSMVGLSESERKKINALLSNLKVLKIDQDISRKYTLLLNKYGEQQTSIADFIIAATAWSKNIPILTRNKKHFEIIQEISLCPVYEK